MSIEFTCPNGHRLSTKDDDAGKMVKCPKCGAVTKVPGLNGSASKISTAEASAVVLGSAKGMAAKAISDDAGSSKSGLSSVGAKELKTDGGKSGFPAIGQASGTNDPVRATGESPAGRAEESIVLLCPNGHRLNAPRRMQGHAGKCPQCGARFQIPFIDESGGDDDGSTVDDLGNYQGMLETPPATALAAGQTAPAPAPSARPPGGEFQFWEPEQHPLAALVMRLWSEREHGGVIELHLAGGAILVPDWFDRRLSQGPHGLFAAQAADGTVTMTIVPWETVTRVVVRGVVGLPDGMFE